MKEDFLHFLWEYGLFDTTAPKTTAGEPIEIVSHGQRNTDAGPDFFNAKIKIGATLWAGNVEIHRRSSDWHRHDHHHDKAYDNVVLHVVADDDRPVARSTGAPLPTWVVRYPPALEARYTAFLQSSEWIPCGKEAAQVERFRIEHFLSRLLVERMERKAQTIYETLQNTRNDWREAFYQLLCRAFGFGVNAAPFELLAKLTPLAALEKHRHAPAQIEALLFGQAGFLSDAPSDSYRQSLRNEYLFLQKKFTLKPMEVHLWKFLRLRPSNFPTIRIAQLAALLQRFDTLMDTMRLFGAADDLYRCFDVRASEYWDTHFLFGKTARSSPKTLGAASIQRMLINVVVPFLFAWGRRQADDKWCDKAMTLLETLPPEKNHITAGWAQTGIKAENAFYAQALIQLKTDYCDKRRCLQCSIGTNLLKQCRREGQ
jgi:hypothetical protein